MQLAGPHRFADPRRFGRGPVKLVGEAPQLPAFGQAWGADAKLFASTFAAGFLFVTCFLA